MSISNEMPTEDTSTDDTAVAEVHDPDLKTHLAECNMTNGDDQQPVNSVSEPELENDPTPEAPVRAAKTKLCGVCKDTVSKYKCSRCELPYCSLVCNTIHQANHPAVEPKQPPQQPEPVPVSPPVAVARAGPLNPFSALDDSPELKELFRIYPGLPQQLLEIDAATQVDRANGHSGGRGYDFVNGRNGQLNQDPGLQSGLKALYTARRSVEGEAVLEYGKLVLQILSRDATVDAPSLVHHDIEKESAQLVALLLQAEENS